ncbi:hypothetical protein AMTR_s00057p00120370 [Amborella trichopoda]|uniref:Myb-like domain-containing protein n=2 Tax=Amborella trichopoda TaxID=13333 RepID=U5D8W4_AMBTC|nr:hypothetical protein AMTR_s00057p00120370 [Amborella trichopoda]
MARNGEEPRCPQENETEEQRENEIDPTATGRRWEVDLTSEISEDEEDLITRLYKLLGERWDLIAGRLPWRTKEQVESFWRAKTGREHQEQQPTCNPE